MKAEGIDGVSMRRLAGEFETGPSSLYAHVTSKDELLLDHYDLARSALATIPTGPNALRVSDAVLGMMLAGGVEPRAAAMALDRIFLYVSADAYEMSIWRGNVAESGRDGEAFPAELAEDLVAYFKQVPEELYPNIRKHAEVMAGGCTDARFELGLELLVGGLDKYVTK